MLSSRLLALFPALLLTSASALNLTVSARSNVAGTAPVSALSSAPDGSALLCLGSRWVQLDSAGKLLRATSLAAPCDGLSVSPSGQRLLTTTVSGATVWNLADGSKVADLAIPNAKNRVGFVSDDELLAVSATGIDRLTIASGERQSVRQGVVNALFVAPDAKRAVISDGQKVQLLKLADFSVLSGIRCEITCTAQNANFSADGRTVVVHDGDNLLGLREGVPASTVLHHVQAAAGLPQPDNTILTFAVGNAESHDLQTGRRESVLVTGGILPLARQLAAGRVLTLNDKGELLSADRAFKDVQRVQLPAAPSAGAVDASGAVYALNAGTLTLGGKKVAGTYWDVQTMNKATWVLAMGTDGGLQVGTLSGDKFTALPGSRTATHLSVNFWGNHAAVWDDETLTVVSQPKAKVVASVKLPLTNASVTLSPDATRAYVVPVSAADGKPFVVTLSNAKRQPLPESASGWWTGAQVSGKGVLALNSKGGVSLVLPDGKMPFGAIAGEGKAARFSPDSAYLALPVRGDVGPRLDLVNVVTGKVEASSPTLADLPTFIAWSADSKKVTVGASLASELGSTLTFELK